METGKYKDKNGTTRVGDALRFLAKQGKAFAPELLELASNVTGVKALDKLGDAIRGDKALTPQDKDLLLAELNKDIAIEQEITKRGRQTQIAITTLVRIYALLRSLFYLYVCLYSLC